MKDRIDKNVDGAAFYCPYCRCWITDTTHRKDFHNDLNEPDNRRDDRLRINGVVYEDEDAYRNKERR